MGPEAAGSGLAAFGLGVEQLTLQPAVTPNHDSGHIPGLEVHGTAAMGRAVVPGDVVVDALPAIDAFFRHTMIQVRI